MQRLSTIIAGLFLFAAALAPAAQAADWPTRPVKVITPQPAGTGIDLAARLFAERLSIKWGQGVVVENRPGADGVLGVTAFVNARDDHTLLFSFGSPITITPVTSENKLPYDPIADLVPIGSVVDFILGFSAGTSTNIKTLAELEQAVRKDPDKFNWGATAGLPQFVFAGYVKKAKLSLSEVPYKDLTPALMDLTSGRIQFFATSYASLRSTFDAQQARMLVVLNGARAPQMPDVPTMAELGYPELSVDSFAGFFGGRGINEELRRKIAADIRAIGQDPQIDERLSKFGIVTKVTGPEEFTAMIRKQGDTVVSILRSIGR